MPAERLTHIDRVTGDPIRRYEHDKPGDMLHVDVKKLGRVPDGGGWRYVAKQQGDRNRAATATRTGGPKNKHHHPLIGTCYLHTVIDDHSRVAYVEAHDDETAATATAVLRNAVDWFNARGVTVTRVLSDNGSAYKSHLWRDTCAELGITVKKTRPYRPQTNGKIERFHRTLAEGWAFKKFYNSESARLAALPGWVHEYNHRRPHTAIGKVPPITRLDQPGWTSQLVDGRQDLAHARDLCHLIRTTGARQPVLLIIAEGGLAVVSHDWGMDDVVLHACGPAELEARPSSRPASGSPWVASPPPARPATPMPT